MAYRNGPLTGTTSHHCHLVCARWRRTTSLDVSEDEEDEDNAANDAGNASDSGGMNNPSHPMNHEPLLMPHTLLSIGFDRSHEGCCIPHEELCV